MNNQPIENPPAFPNGFAEVNDGMTLRDFFAAKAMAALLIAPNGGTNFTADEETGAPMEAWDDYAKGSYQMADAMLKARQS